jgi:hypothetical protein
MNSSLVVAVHMYDAYCIELSHVGCIMGVHTRGFINRLSKLTYEFFVSGSSAYL